MYPLIAFFGIIGKPSTRRCAHWPFRKFPTKRKNILNLDFHWKLNIKLKKCVFEPINVSSYHIRNCICLSMSWGNAWEFPIGHPPIKPFQSINAFSCHHKKIHSSRGKYIGNLQLATISAFALLILSICLFTSQTLTLGANDI
jgi:hypothetical protein